MVLPLIVALATEITCTKHTRTYVYMYKVYAHTPMLHVYTNIT